MDWNRPATLKGSPRVWVEPFAYINKLPAAFWPATAPTFDLECDYYNTISMQLRKQVWLDCFDVPVIVPMHEMSFSNCINKIHR